MTSDSDVLRRVKEILAPVRSGEALDVENEDRKFFLVEGHVSYFITLPHPLAQSGRRGEDRMVWVIPPTTFYPLPLR